MTEAREFRRRRHLLFAASAFVVISVAVRAGWRPIELLGASLPFEPSDILLWKLIPFVGVAAVAWLAFEVFDTHAKVHIASPGWWKIGWEPWLMFVAISSAQVAWPHLSNHEPELLRKLAHNALSSCYDSYYGVAWGWLVAVIVAGAVTEELVFRGLLQRALEGYVDPRLAVFLQAAVFHWTHGAIYEHEFVGPHLFTGIIYGMAFMRTRSLLMPTLLHASSNLLLALTFAPMLG